MDETKGQWFVVLMLVLGAMGLTGLLGAVIFGANELDDFTVKCEKHGGVAVKTYSRGLVCIKAERLVW